MGETDPGLEGCDIPRGMGGSIPVLYCEDSQLNPTQGLFLGVLKRWQL